MAYDDQWRLTIGVVTDNDRKRYTNKLSIFNAARSALKDALFKRNIQSFQMANADLADVEPSQAEPRLSPGRLV